MGEIRFGLGRCEELHSSTWKVKTGSDGSLYVMSRDVGHAIKASLHPMDPQNPGREWRVAINPGSFAEIAGLDGPLLYEWDSEEGRIAGSPFRQAFAVVLGRFSLAVDPPLRSEEEEQRRRHYARVTWINDVPPTGAAWQFTVLIGDKGILSTAPGARAMNAIPVGELRTSADEQVWVVRHLKDLTPDEMETLHRYHAVMSQFLGDRPPHEKSVLRLHPLGSNDGLRWFMDLGVTVGQKELADKLSAEQLS